jgi:hypothetical protein
MAAGSTFTPIATTTLSSAQSSVTFSSISGSYTDLYVLISAAATSNTNVIYCQVGNGSIDTGSNYSNTYLYGSGSAAGSGRYTNASYWYAAFELMITDFSQNVVMQFQNYSNTTTKKTSLTRYNEATAGVGAFANLWNSTSAIDTIKFSISGTNFAIGSTFTIYGIAAA